MDKTSNKKSNKQKKEKVKDLGLSEHVEERNDYNFGPETPKDTSPGSAGGGPVE